MAPDKLFCLLNRNSKYSLKKNGNKFLWLTSQYLNSDLSDFSVHLAQEDGTTIRCPLHKFVLCCQSSKFRDVLSEGSEKYALRGYEARTLEYFVRYVYTRELPSKIPNHNLIELLKLSHQLDHTDLFEECSQQLARDVSLNVACEVLELSKSLNDAILKVLCSTLINTNVHLMMRNDLHFELDQELLEDIIDTNKQMVQNDIELKRAIVRWTDWKCFLRGLDRRQLQEVLGSLNDILQWDIEEVLSSIRPIYTWNLTSAEMVQNLFMNSDLSDLDILIDKCPGARMPGHSLVLNGQSVVLREIWDNVVAEIRGKKDQNPEILLTDVSARVAHYMLRFLYTGFLPTEISEKNLVELYQAADHYKIEPLKSECSYRIKKNICVTNCCQLLVLTDAIANDSLRNECLKKLMKNKQAIFKNCLHFCFGKRIMLDVCEQVKKVNMTPADLKAWGKWCCCLEDVEPSENNVCERTTPVVPFLDMKPPKINYMYYIVFMMMILFLFFTFPAVTGISVFLVLLYVVSRNADIFKITYLVFSVGFQFISQV